MRRILQISWLSPRQGIVESENIQIPTDPSWALLLAALGSAVSFFMNEGRKYPLQFLETLLLEQRLSRKLFRSCSDYGYRNKNARKQVWRLNQLWKKYLWKEKFTKTIVSRKASQLLKTKEQCHSEVELFWCKSNCGWHVTNFVKFPSRVELKSVESKAFVALWKCVTERRTLRENEQLHRGFWHLLLLLFGFFGEMFKK